MRKREDRADRFAFVGRRIEETQWEREKLAIERRTTEKRRKISPASERVFSFYLWIFFSASPRHSRRYWTKFTRVCRVFFSGKLACMFLLLAMLSSFHLLDDPYTDILTLYLGNRSYLFIHDIAEYKFILFRCSILRKIIVFVLLVSSWDWRRLSMGKVRRE